MESAPADIPLWFFALAALPCVLVPLVLFVLVRAFTQAGQAKVQARNELQQWAQARGFTVSENDQAFLRGLTRFRFASHGRPASPFVSVRGPNVFFFGYVNLFEATVTLGTDHRHVAPVTACVHFTPSSSAPAFVLRRKSAGTSLGDALLGSFDLSNVLNSSGLSFTDDPAFTAQWALTGDDEAALRAFFTPERRAQIMTSSAYVVEHREGSLVVFVHGAMSPERLEQAESMASLLRSGWA